MSDVWCKSDEKCKLCAEPEDLLRGLMCVKPMRAWCFGLCRTCRLLNRTPAHHSHSRQKSNVFFPCLNLQWNWSSLDSDRRHLYVFIIWTKTNNTSRRFSLLGFRTDVHQYLWRLLQFLSRDCLVYFILAAFFYSISHATVTKRSLFLIVFGYCYKACFTIVSLI